MHQIVCRLGLHLRPHWGSLQCSPDPLAGLGGGPPGKGKERRQGKVRGRERGKEGREEEGKGRGGHERGSWTPQIFRWIDAFGRTAVVSAIDQAVKLVTCTFIYMK